MEKSFERYDILFFLPGGTKKEEKEAVHVENPYLLVLCLIAAGQLVTTPFIPHRFHYGGMDEAYRLFENKLDGVITVAVVNG